MPAMRDKRTGRFAKPTIGATIRIDQMVENMVRDLNSRNIRNHRPTENVDHRAMVQRDQAIAKNNKKKEV